MNTANTNNSYATVGRPTVITTTVINKLEEVFALDGSIKEACFYADISEDAYYRWIKRNPQFTERFDALRQQPVLAARRNLVEHAKTDPLYSLKYLERKARKEFAEKQEVSENRPVSLNVYNYFNNPQVKEAVNELEDQLKAILIQPNQEP